MKMFILTTKAPTYIFLVLLLFLATSCRGDDDVNEEPVNPDPDGIVLKTSTDQNTLI